MELFFNFLKRNKFFLGGLVVLGWVVFINLFPEGYVFGGGDTNQLINARESFKNNFFGWEGRVGLFYALFYLLSFVGISESIQLSFYLGFIIFGSYLSFQLFSRFIFPKSDDLSRSLASLFYALNLYTLFLFTGNWGYSYFPSLYVFVPVLIGVFLKFLNSQKFIYGIVFCVVLFLASSGFGNPAFALSFAILLFFLTLILLYVKKNIPDKLFVGKIILIILISFLTSAFWIFPLAPQMRSGVEGLSSSNVIDFETIIRSSANPISYTIALMQDTKNNFPFNFYYKNLDFLEDVFILLAFIPVILAFFGFIFIQKMKSRVLFLTILSTFLVFVMFVAKVRPPFEISNYFIYHIWGFNTLRGYDKTAIYIPFLIASLFLVAMLNLKNKKFFYIGVLLALLALLAPLPFYVGKLQQTAGYRVNSEKNYKKAKMSFLVKIPEEYYSVRSTINTDIIKSKIAVLPATLGDGSGVTYFPKWEFYGVDITRDLYVKNLLDANASQYNFPNWNYADDFSEQGESKNNDWIVKTLGMMNAKYIIYHKDAPDDSVQKTIGKMKNLEERGLIKDLEENDYFILYEISKDYFLPYLSSQAENFSIQGNIDSIERNFAKIKNGSTEIEFQEINPKKFIIDLKDQELGENLVLAETFNPLWKAYGVDVDGKETEIKDHFVARGYANGWRIENEDDIAKIVIEYYPTRLMWRGMWISGITVLFLIIYLLKYYYVQRKLAKN